MADTSSLPQLPPNEPSGSWLARNRRFAILGGVILILGIGTLVANSLRQSPAGQSTSNTNTVTSSLNSNRESFQRIPAKVIDDKDGDGLSDAEERQAGTNPELADSDDDGLTDREEVQVYKSDPLRADTDGDGPNDSQEVRGGYNPSGPGLLRDVSQAIQNINAD